MADSRTLQGRRITAWRIGLAIGLLCGTAWSETGLQAPLEVGQRWQYRHEGPRPGSPEPNAIDGERILWVLNTVDGEGGRQWVVEERFTRDEKAVGRFLVREDGLLGVIGVENDKGETAWLRYDPAIPYRPAGMAVGETQAISTSLRLDSADFTLPCKITIERLADESIVTPAGEFPGCSHYRVATTSTIDIKIGKIAITEEREQWHHPAAGGMVKETYRRDPVKFLTWSRPGYTATSVLTKYDRQEPDPTRHVTASSAPKRTEDSEQAQQAPRPPERPWNRLVGLAAILAFVAGTFLVVRRRRNR